MKKIISKKPDEERIRRRELSEKNKKARMITRAVYAALLLGVLIYAIITVASGRKKPGGDTPSVPAGNGQSDTQGDPGGPADPNISESQGSASEPGTPIYDTSGSRVVLKAGEGTDGTAIRACYVYVPAGYEATSGTASVTLAPEGMDMSVTGNRALKISWGSVFEFERLKSDWLVRDPKSGTYRVIAKYEYIAHESALADVYVIERRPLPERTDDQIIYTVALDVSSGGRYPRMSLTESELPKFLNSRYPDVLELAKAIFRPENPSSIISVDEIPGIPEISGDLTDDQDMPSQAGPGESVPNTENEP